MKSCVSELLPLPRRGLAPSSGIAAERRRRLAGYPRVPAGWSEKQAVTSLGHRSQGAWGPRGRAEGCAGRRVGRAGG